MKKVIFHGVCVGCVNQKKYGKLFCMACRYRDGDGNWKKMPDMCSTHVPKPGLCHKCKREIMNNPNPEPCYKCKEDMQRTPVCLRCGIIPMAESSFTAQDNEIKRLKEALGVIVRNVKGGAVTSIWCGEFAEKALEGK